MSEAYIRSMDDIVDFKVDDIKEEVKAIINNMSENEFPHPRDLGNNWLQYCELVQGNASFHVKLCNETFEGYIYQILEKLSDFELKLLVFTTLDYDCDAESINDEHIVNFCRKLTIDFLVNDLIRNLENEADSHEFPYE